jgi:AcrR family transcriptional regulator
LITAAFDTLQEEGFAATSARAIAERGGFNQTQIFYYFGSVNSLLVAAFEQSSMEQLAAYVEALEGVTTITGLFDAVRARIEGDLESGHMKVLAELAGGSTSDPGLKAEVARCFEPWFEFTRATLDRILAASGLDALLPPDQMALIVLALFLGIQQLVNLTDQTGAALEAFATGQRFAGLFDQMFSAAGPAVGAGPDERKGQ